MWLSNRFPIRTNFPIFPKPVATRTSGDRKYGVRGKTRLSAYFSFATIKNIVGLLRRMPVGVTVDDHSVGCEVAKTPFSHAEQRSKSLPEVEDSAADHGTHLPAEATMAMVQEPTADTPVAAVPQGAYSNGSADCVPLENGDALANGFDRAQPAHG